MLTGCVQNEEALCYPWWWIFTQLSPWRDVSSRINSSSPSQEIPRILWSPKFQYHIHKNPSLLLILSQTNPIHVQCYFLRIHFNIILPCTPRFSNHLFPLGYPATTMHASCFYLIWATWWICTFTLNSGLKGTRGHGTADTNWIAPYDYFNIKIILFRGSLSLWT